MSSEITNKLPPRAVLNASEQEALVTARVAFSTHGIFFCYYYYDQLEEYPTRAVPTLATDGRRLFINPEYFKSLKPMERAFALAHETAHAMLSHSLLMKHYSKTGKVGNLPFDAHTVNVAMDLIINANLIKDQIGTCNPEWLYDPAVTDGSHAVADVYKKIYRSGRCGAGTGVGKYGRGSVHDKVAEANDGVLDEVLPPRPSAEAEGDDVPSEMEHREAVARAASAAKDAGKGPGSFQRFVNDILNPQIRWQDHLRFIIAGKIGRQKESWERANRRYLSLPPYPLAYLPGKSGFGCHDVTVVVDNSGSVSETELSAFFGEASAILNDCKPKLVRIIWCDEEVQRVEEARSLDELAHIRIQGSRGGGGTSFRPPFAWLKQHGITPDTLVYLTDMYGDGWPADPGYPVIWCATTGVVAPWGTTVRIEI